MLDYEAGDAEAIAEGMREALGTTVTGMVTTSIRTVNLDGVDIEKGDYIGFTNKTMLVAEKKKEDAFFALSKKLCAAERDFMIVFFGKDVTDSEMEQIGKTVAREYPSIEYYPVKGGQDVYSYVIILE